MGSDSNSSTRSDTTNNTNIVTTNTDRRATVGNGALSASGDNSSVYSSSNTSWSAWSDYDSTNQTSYDNHAIYNTNDPDVVRAIAQMGQDSIRATGGSVVDLMESAGTSNAAAWQNTIGAGERMLDSMMGTSASIFEKNTGTIDRVIEKVFGQAVDTNKTSERIAIGAMNAYQPTANKDSDAQKYIGLAAVAAAAMIVMQGKK